MLPEWTQSYVSAVTYVSLCSFGVDVAMWLLPYRVNSWCIEGSCNNMCQVRGHQHCNTKHRCRMSLHLILRLAVSLVGCAAAPPHGWD